MKYVYVPFYDDGMDSFARSLANVKNKKYRFLDRLGGKNDLARVGYNNILYVLIHGSAKGGFAGGHANYKKYVKSGTDVALELIVRGLKNTKMHLILWTCFGGIDAKDDKHWSTVGGNDHRSFVCRVHAALGQYGRNKIKVTGFTKKVSISNTALSQNKKLTLLEDGDDLVFLDPEDHKVVVV